MLKRYSNLTGILISLTLLFVATLYYPGGSQHDRNSIGYDWKNNYLSNLFGKEAVNVSNNLTSRAWASCGVFFLCRAIATFFWQFSKRIPVKSAAVVIKYPGLCASIFAFLAVTSFHDLMVTLSGTCALVAVFYVTVCLFKSKLGFIKIFPVVFLLFFYCCNFVYYTRIYLELLSVMQKILLLLTITWVLYLEYFAIAADFQLKKNIQPAVGNDSAASQ